jgi:hypothetical protein
MRMRSALERQVRLPRRCVDSYQFWYAEISARATAINVADCVEKWRLENREFINSPRQQPTTFFQLE